MIVAIIFIINLPSIILIGEIYFLAKILTRISEVTTTKIPHHKHQEKKKSYTHNVDQQQQLHPVVKLQNTANTKDDQFVIHQLHPKTNNEKPKPKKILKRYAIIYNYYLYKYKTIEMKNFGNQYLFDSAFTYSYISLFQFIVHFSSNYYISYCIQS